MKYGVVGEQGKQTDWIGRRKGREKKNENTSRDSVSVPIARSLPITRPLPTTRLLSGGIRADGIKPAANLGGQFRRLQHSSYPDAGGGLEHALCANGGQAYVAARVVEVAGTGGVDH